jgi:hypothetical protein
VAQLRLNIDIEPAELPQQTAPCPVCGGSAELRPGSGPHYRGLYCPACRMFTWLPKPRLESRQPLESTERHDVTSPDHAAQNLSPGEANPQGSGGSKVDLGTGEARQRFQENRHHER